MCEQSAFTTKFGKFWKRNMAFWMGRRHGRTSNFIASATGMRYARIALAILPSFVFPDPNTQRLLHCVCNVTWLGGDTHNIWGFLS